MKTTPTLIALGLLALSSGAQAATWTLGDTTLGGLRVGAVSFDGLPAGVEIGNLTDHLNDVFPTYVAAGSWRSFTAAWGGNTIDVGLTHEANVDTSVGGDASVAHARLMTSAVLENAVITQPTMFSAVALAPASLKQDFILTPELGEALGMPVYVTLGGSYAHTATLGTGLSAYLFSSAAFYLNGNPLLTVGPLSGVGGDAGNLLTFVANLGDTLTVELFNTTQIGAANLALAMGALPEALADGQLGVQLSISPIPEPETWAMLLAGLGLVGLQLRRKPRINHKLEI
jgi:hypothetical protein